MEIIVLIRDSKYLNLVKKTMEKNLKYWELFDFFWKIEPIQSHNA